MCLRKLSAILLLISLWTASSYEQDNSDSSFDEGLTLENDNNTGNVLYEAKNCVSEVDCHHLGKCETMDDRKFCNCKNGTSGDFCETVDECADELCGTSDDVSCVFDTELDKAVCKCDNETKTYVPDEERCMSPCTRYECGINGYCHHKIGNQRFCACELGAIGDYCEIIEWCHTKKVDCGVDNNATCTLGTKGTAYCECDDPTLGFDYDEKVCKDCSGCGKDAYSQGGCVYRGGRRICPCRSRYYSSDEGKCEDCKCSLNGYSCLFVNGTKFCKCYSGYSQKEDICEVCNCGPGQSKCEFVLNKRVCTCKEGYATEGAEGNCREMCNDTVPCQNGGKCVRNFCKCLKGTRGDRCEIVEYCTVNRCGSGSECAYNVTSQVGYCKCKDPKEIFDDHYRYCRECNCKSHSSPEGCYFKFGVTVCQCDKGYSQYENYCKECDCGENGICLLNYWGAKDCKCNEGYTEESGTCKKCDCGANGYCRFDYKGKKDCNCNSGYQEYKGTCTACDCGDYAQCEILSFGVIKCTCRSGYASQYGKCRECNCYPGTNCTFNGVYGKKCICPKEYADDSGTCKDCDCKIEGANCSFVSGVKTCQCPQGYEPVPVTSKFLRTYCDDVDECKQYDACPSSTNCVNTIGSYDCVCKDGYEEYFQYDNKKDGCRDIDECMRNYRPCNSPNARCVNTPGSYWCICPVGYILNKYPEEKMNTCTSEMRPWRTATIVVGGLAGVITAILLVVVIVKRYRL